MHLELRSNLQILIFDAFFSREPASTSLENALMAAAGSPRACDHLPRHWNRPRNGLSLRPFI
jgi:hypothetical protein